MTADGAATATSVTCVRVVSTSASSSSSSSLSLLLLGLSSGVVAFALPAHEGPGHVLQPCRLRVSRGPVRNLASAADVDRDGSVVALSSAPYATVFDVWGSLDAAAGHGDGSSRGAAGGWRDALIDKKKKQRLAKRLEREPQSGGADAVVTLQALDTRTPASTSISDARARLVELTGHQLPVTDAIPAMLDAVTFGVWTSSLDGAIRGFRRSDGALIRMVALPFPATCLGVGSVHAGTATWSAFDRLVVGGTSGRAAIIDLVPGSRPGRDATCQDRRDGASGGQAPLVMTLSSAVAASPMHLGRATTCSVANTTAEVTFEQPGAAAVTLTWCVAANPTLSAPEVRLTTEADPQEGARVPCSSVVSTAAEVGYVATWPPRSATLRIEAEHAIRGGDHIAIAEAEAAADPELEELRQEHEKLQTLCAALMQEVKKRRAEVVAVNAS